MALRFAVPARVSPSGRSASIGHDDAVTVAQGAKTTRNSSGPVGEAVLGVLFFQARCGRQMRANLERETSGTTGASLARSARVGHLIRQCTSCQLVGSAFLPR